MLLLICHKNGSTQDAENRMQLSFAVFKLFEETCRGPLGVHWDPGAQKIIFSSLRKNQKIFRMVLTIDSPLFLDIDQNCQNNQSSKINGFRVAGAQKRKFTRTLTFNFSGYISPILVIFISKYMFLRMLNPSVWLKNT